MAREDSPLSDKDQEILRRMSLPKDQYENAPHTEESPVFNLVLASIQKMEQAGIDSPIIKAQLQSLLNNPNANPQDAQNAWFELDSLIDLKIQERRSQDNPGWFQRIFGKK